MNVVMAKQPKMGCAKKEGEEELNENDKAVVFHHGPHHLLRE